MQSHEYYPTSENEVLQILQDAKAKSLSVHPFSGGHNWGYGEDISLNPANYKINFSKMNKIIGFDTDFGLLRIQPGVTQKDLENFLIQNNLDYYVPNTGAGGRGSILGNALERGFGIAPIQDHASSIVSLKGFLADGSVYESTLKEIDSTLAECFQWGIGPQLDLLASQSSWIIITEVTIQLVKKFERTDILIASFADKQIGAVVETLRGLTQALPGNIGSIKILNRKQVLENSGNASFPGALKKLSKEWFITVVVYSNSMTRNSVLKSAKSQLQGAGLGFTMTLNKRRIEFLNFVLKGLEFKFLSSLKNAITDLNELFKLADGFVSEVGFKALDKNFEPTRGAYYDMSSLKENLVWFSPLAPLRETSVEKLLSLMRAELANSSFEAKTMTWTVLNSKTIALVIPFTFSGANEQLFWKWYKQLHLNLKKEGFVPYRFHTKMMDFLSTDLLPEHFKFVRKFKNCFDPNDSINQGKYC